MEDWQHGGFGLYLHWPFCESKCPYCDFNSHVAERIDMDAWRHAYLSEIRRAARETQGRVLNTVFFGGGTPSLMTADLVRDLLNCIRDFWPTSNSFEVTIEANPSSVEASRFSRYRAAGVNRVSLGIQALNDPDLNALGRLHSADDALRALRIAQDTFERVSFDLIYARQNQSLEDWRDELDRALNLSVGHLSLYQLTIEPGTAFGRRANAGRLPGLPSDDLGADMYVYTQEHCAAHGLKSYEVSNYALDGHESQHNLIYWRNGDFIGIGPGAHGRLTFEDTRFATEEPRNPNMWLESAGNRESDETSRHALSPRERQDEYLIMGLRLTEGISVERLHRLGPARLAPEHALELGMITLENERLRTTYQGRLVLNSLIPSLLEEA